MMRTTIALILCFIGTHAFAEAPAKRTFEIHQIDEEIKIDGVLNEKAWKSAPTFTLDYETSPGENTPPAQKTEMWLAYSYSHLYVGVRAHDSDPSKIRARLTDRDRAFQDDFVGVVLDTFNDERRAFEFFVNPYGVQMDLTQNDVTGQEDESWDAIWNSAGKLTADGYEVEMEIPFSSLRFPASSVQTWGIDALRIYPRDKRYRFGLNALPRGQNCYLCSESKLTGFVGLKPGKNMEFDPTLTGQGSDQREDPGASFDRDTKADPGLTMRWGITPGITLNGAANPDFSQVEADAAQLTVNKAFAIFYPEKRPFFLEGADFFDTKIRAVYSRDIADPSYGVKLTGKEGRSAFGAIFARDDLTNFIFPGSQSSSLGSLDEENTSTILRYRYDLGNGASTVGAIMTDREGTGYHNRVVGGDTLIRHNKEALRIEFLGSNTEYPFTIQNDFDQPDGTLTGTSLRAVWQHTDRNWMGYVNYTGASNDFRADLGFIPQVGFHQGYGIYERYYYWDNNQHWYNKLTIGSETTWTYDRDGNPLQQQVAPYFFINGVHEYFSNTYFGIGPMWYGGQRFDRNFINHYMEVRPDSWIYVTFETRIGQEVDYDNIRQGHIVRFIPGLRFDLARHLRLEINENWERLNVLDGQELYHASVSDVRTTYQINTRTFVRLITQYFDVHRNPALYTFDVDKKDQFLANQFLFAYKINPQVVMFLGYSDNYQNMNINRLTQANRTVFFKVGYAFVM